MAIFAPAAAPGALGSAPQREAARPCPSRYSASPSTPARGPGEFQPLVNPMPGFPYSCCQAKRMPRTARRVLTRTLAWPVDAGSSTSTVSAPSFGQLTDSLDWRSARPPPRRAGTRRAAAAGQALRRRARSRQGGARAHHLDAETSEQLQVARDGAIAEQDDAPGRRERPRRRVPGQRLLFAALHAWSTPFCFVLSLGQPAVKTILHRGSPGTGPLSKRVSGLTACARGQESAQHSNSRLG